ncbi:hypothetical protein [Nocardia neocaledoniensis]|uniref:hypothetical protein n=1 Tax=Nocardia neocaledoniensis TaxID=236511 RepID=UPI0011B58A7B|nr:hypothetical protein [Nocardia neocaledoniensis]
MTVHTGESFQPVDTLWKPGTLVRSQLGDLQVHLHARVHFSPAQGPPIRPRILCDQLLHPYRGLRHANVHIGYLAHTHLLVHRPEIALCDRGCGRGVDAEPIGVDAHRWLSGQNRGKPANPLKVSPAHLDIAGTGIALLGEPDP